MKLTIIFAGILAANSLAVAQDPAGSTMGQTNQVQQPVVLPDASRPQQLTSTNQTTGGSTTNVPSSATTSTNGSNTSTIITNRPVTIIRGSDATATGSSSSHLSPQNDNGIDPVKSTAGTPDDWRSGNSVPHVVPPRDPSANP